LVRPHTNLSTQADELFWNLFFRAYSYIPIRMVISNLLNPNFS
jgi:hypothetical protein